MTSCGSVVILCNEQIWKKKKNPHFSSILLIRFSDPLQKHYWCKLISGIWDSWEPMFVAKAEAKEAFSTLSPSTFGTGSHASSAKGPSFPISHFAAGIFLKLRRPSYLSPDPILGWLCLSLPAHSNCVSRFFLAHLLFLTLFSFYLISLKSSMFINTDFWLFLIYCSLWKPVLEHRGGHPWKSTIFLRPPFVFSMISYRTLPSTSLTRLKSPLLKFMAVFLFALLSPLRLLDCHLMVTVAKVALTFISSTCSSSFVCLETL